MSAKLLIIALDGADGKLIDRWTSDGTLPNLAVLRDMGSSTSLAAPDGVTDDGLWASFKYGVGLGEHGRYHFLQRLSTGKMGMAYLDEIDRGSFWEKISESGFRVAIFDIPKCGTPHPINGIHLVDWLVHGRYFHDPVSYPESLAADVLESFGPAPPRSCNRKPTELSDSETADIVGDLRGSVTQKRAAGVHYLASEAWDLFAIGFKEAHCAGHHFGGLTDSQDSEVQAEQNSSEKALREIYSDIDSAVGELIQTAGEDAKIVAFCTTEMVPNSTLIHLMPEIVDRINQKLGESGFSHTIHRISRKFLGTSAVRHCEILPYNENCTALRIEPKLGVFSLLSGSTNDKTHMTEYVASLVEQLRESETGQPVIASIDRPSAECDGSRTAQLPDLLIHYSPEACPASVESSELGSIAANPPHIRRGNHAPGGLFIQSWNDGGEIRGMEDIGEMSARVVAK